TLPTVEVRAAVPRWLTLGASDPQLSRLGSDWAETSGISDGFGPNLGQPKGRL
ncbi:hypothetical protein PanWU01x14_079790, partial [Parasponia andersonii]